MAQLFSLNTFASDSGYLTVIEKVMPGRIRRFFYNQEAEDRLRLGHRHHKAWHVIICLKGNTRIYTHNGRSETWFTLDTPQQCLILEPQDWHCLDELSAGALLLVLSNEPYDPADVIYSPYPAN
ncbi:hypothetical protein GCM10027347_28650 [Larkinella harenae]